ncbi:MAG TPA: metal-dependent hydrolase [Anaerolineaceae bacterium]|jgi:L-ascorbate metabolism protein UlaG (beta-lactamase superfamily)|nr:metal-dependent hydrolase [Anaerolineaceae bacterium]HNZ14527.1 metal-dependent hydrolase [Anaerolineaceae bacterium]HOH91767.1 metal-dependent hydrolase [Anaerolineaceae bacterium]HQL92416.1 metal-dependent hydrolase [Anaerolineaceae bacterium]
MKTTFTWYGHATLGLTVGEHKLLVDPFFTGNPVAPITADEAFADFILITHGHGDHVGDAQAIAKRNNALIISNFEIAGWFAEQGLESHAQHLGGGFHHPFGYLKLTLALHGSALPDGGYGGNPAGLLLTTPDGKKIYMAGDTGLFGDMQLIGDEGIDLAVIPIGDNYTMGPDDALRAVKLLRPKQVVPIHYNTWPLIEQDPHAWKARVEAETSAKVVVLKPGESLDLDS